MQGPVKRLAVDATLRATKNYEGKKTFRRAEKSPWKKNDMRTIRMALKAGALVH